ncbi:MULTISPECIES: hypothetical protein [unclassified Bacillus (in: firmicutes)]|uniref:hypothetical protein n=1 Tax=unclassified Bacillus (in: firmicutes) TaxID=185979 RepID=UPI000E359F1D|nr:MULTISPECIES: hypothetical protein [unclassified Bacillus (in: firmicutes)]AXR16935.1 hypothetical protein DOS87_12730 [Bacillus sp. CR71]AXR22630.1 hypothetical protein DPQ26_12495 [Bacillus sp. E25]
MEITVQDIKNRVNVQRMPDTVIQELISQYELITKNYLRSKPSNPMKEKVRTSKLAWLSFRAENLIKVIHIGSGEEVTNSVFSDGCTVYGLSENQLYEFEYTIQDYDGLLTLMKKCIIDMTCYAVIRTNLQYENMKKSANIGDYSYEINIESLDEETVNKKILKVLKKYRSRNPLIAL